MYSGGNVDELTSALREGFWYLGNIYSVCGAMGTKHRTLVYLPT